MGNCQRAGTQTISTSNQPSRAHIDLGRRTEYQQTLGVNRHTTRCTGSVYVVRSESWYLPRAKETEIMAALWVHMARKGLLYLLFKLLQEIRHCRCTVCLLKTDSDKSSSVHHYLYASLQCKQ